MLGGQRKEKSFRLRCAVLCCGKGKGKGMRMSDAEKDGCARSVLERSRGCFVGLLVQQ